MFDWVLNTVDHAEIQIRQLNDNQAISNTANRVQIFCTGLECERNVTIFSNNIAKKPIFMRNPLYVFLLSYRNIYNKIVISIMLIVNRSENSIQDKAIKNVILKLQVLVSALRDHK